MVVNNNLVPLVLVIVIIGIVLGMALFGLAPFNQTTITYNVNQRATRDAFDNNATQVAYYATQTPIAIAIRQTAMAEQVAEQPQVQTATQLALDGERNAAQYAATQTSIALDTLNRIVSSSATQTSIAYGQYFDNLSAAATATTYARNATAGVAPISAGFSIISLVVIIICVWITGKAMAHILRTREREKNTQARLLARQRELAALQASLSKSNSVEGHNGNGSART